MKSLTVLIFIFLLSDSLFAQNENQIKKGNFIAGGSISLDLSRNKYFDSNFSADIASLEVKSFTILPELDLKYLITDHLALGLITEDLFSFSWIKDNLNSNTKKDIITDFFLGPVVRYYTRSDFFLIGSTQIGVYERTVKQRKYLFSTGLGYSVFLGKSVMIESILKYNYFYSEFTKIIEQKEKRNGIEFSMGLQVMFNFKKLNKQNDEN